MRKARLLMAALTLLVFQVPPRAPFVASSEGRVYYWTGGGCRGWKELKPENLRWFQTEAAARDAGYVPSRAEGCQVPRSPPGAR